MAGVSLCCLCLSECTGAHSCSVCHKIVHVICAEASANDEEEGYGQVVVCKKCSEELNDEPPIKKTIDWAIKYPSKSGTLKHKNLSLLINRGQTISLNNKNGAFA